jgi:hypothetical protein
MSTDLHPTKTRLALLRAVYDCCVLDLPADDDGNISTFDTTGVEQGYEARRVTARVDELLPRRLGDARQGPDDVGTHRRRPQGTGRRAAMSGVVCLYFGRRDECPECGGFNGTGGRHCSHDCADSAAARADAAAERERERRAQEDAFGAEVARLLDAGHSYEQIDAMLAGMPS